MALEEVTLFQQFGPAVVLIIIMVIGGKWVIQKSYEQAELTTKNFTGYIETITREHTTAMNMLSEEYVI